MILADASVWVDHFRKKDAELYRQLQQNNISTHPFIVGELALGNLPDRRRALAALDMLPMATTARMDEVRSMIETRSLFRQGLGLIDAHLIASALLTPHTVLWSRDRRLCEIAKALGVNADLP